MRDPQYGKSSHGRNAKVARRKITKSKTIEDLAREQGKKPVADVNVLYGGWPEDELNDGFDEALSQWRSEQE